MNFWHLPYCIYLVILYIYVLAQLSSRPNFGITLCLGSQDSAKTAQMWIQTLWPSDTVPESEF